MVLLYLHYLGGSFGQELLAALVQLGEVLLEVVIDLDFLDGGGNILILFHCFCL